MVGFLSMLCNFSLHFSVILSSGKASSFGIVLHIIVGYVLILNVVFGFHR